MPVAIAPPISATTDENSEGASPTRAAKEYATDRRQVGAGGQAELEEDRSRRGPNRCDELEDEASLQTLEAKMKRIDQR